MSEKDKGYYQKLYEDLSEKYSKAELAESFVFPSDLSEDEQKKAADELLKERKKRLGKRTSEERIYSGLLRIKYQIKAYVSQPHYDEDQTSIYYLNEYLKVTNKKQKELAEDLGVHVTRLSRILNGKEKLSLSLAFRLEIHSGELIPAILWWKLVQKEIEEEINTNEGRKLEEKEKVKNIVFNRA